jgi:serine/threonine-protein kinase RsbW
VSAGVVRLSFPARAEYLILARLALAGVARATAIPEETLADLKLAVTEACGNVVRHAYASPVAQPDGSVRVTIDARPDAISLTVEDDGVGLPPLEALNGSAGDEAAEGGMGLAIIRAIADELEIRPAAGGTGTLLVLRKNL